MKKIFLCLSFCLVFSGCQIDSSERVKISKYFEKDSKNVYYNDVKIEKADPETFEDLGTVYSYAKDKNYVYMAYKKLDLDIDTKTFDFIDDSIYAKDKNKVYYRDYEGELVVIENANPDTFELIIIGSEYEYLAKDDGNYYYQGLTLDNIDYNTLVILSEYYAKDKNNIYYFYYDFYLDNDGKISFEDSLKLDIESLEYLGARFLRDKDYIYYHNISKFVVESYLIKRDEIDINTFKVLGGSYAKDKSNVYYNGKKIEDIDVKTFQFLGVSYDTEKIPYAKDKDNCYIEDKIVDMSECEKFEKYRQ